MEQGSDDRRRAVISALGAFVVLAVIVGVVVLAGGSDEDEGDATTAEFAAPSECIDAWNEDDQAVMLAQHNVAGHGYSAARVGYITEEGTLSDDAEAGDCAVTFGATQLDIELEQAGQVNQGGLWIPLSGDLDAEALEALQISALDTPNAAIGADGRLTPQ